MIEDQNITLPYLGQSSADSTAHCIRASFSSGYSRLLQFSTPAEVKQSGYTFPVAQDPERVWIFPTRGAAEQKKAILVRHFGEDFFTVEPAPASAQTEQNEPKAPEDIDARVRKLRLKLHTLRDDRRSNSEEYALAERELIRLENEQLRRRAPREKIRLRMPAKGEPYPSGLPPTKPLMAPVNHPGEVAPVQSVN